MADIKKYEQNLSDDSDVETDDPFQFPRPLVLGQYDIENQNTKGRPGASKDFCVSRGSSIDAKYRDAGPNHCGQGSKSKMDLMHRKTCTQDEPHIDSGILSMGSNSTCSLEPVCAADKTPIQCSDATEEDEVVRKLSSLNTRDEGFDSIKSDTESMCLSVPDSESDEVVIDLYQRDEDGDTLIHVAICSLYRVVSLSLIELAEAVDCLNMQNNLLQSPLHLAVLTGQVEIVKALVNRGVDVTLRDQQGNTPLHIACRKGDKDSVSLLVQSFGKDKNRRVKYFSTKNCEGLTCLHVAAQEKQFIILGHLFAKGADVNIGDAKSGRTMLHYAVEKKDIETLSLLLTHPEIDVDCKTFKGETPMVLAYWRNYQDIVKKLKSKGAFFSYDLVEESDEEGST